MTTADEIKNRFGNSVLEEIVFHGETTLKVFKSEVKEILRYLQGAGYAVLTDLSAVDYIKDIRVFYWLQKPSDYERIRITVSVGRDETLQTVIDLWEGANWYERELYDLFGVRFEGHPDLTRLLMPDDWVGHPLLKDYPLTEESVQFKYGVQPKVPSKIIVNDLKDFNSKNL